MLLYYSNLIKTYILEIITGYFEGEKKIERNSLWFLELYVKL